MNFYLQSFKISTFSATTPNFDFFGTFNFSITENIILFQIKKNVLHMLFPQYNLISRIQMIYACFYKAVLLT